MATTVAKNSYVIIDANNTVISVFKGEELPEYNENMINVIDVTTVVPKPQLTWTYDSSTKKFSAPAVPEELVEEVVEPTPLELLKQKMYQEIIQDVDYMGTKFQSGMPTPMLLTSYASLLALTGQLPAGFFWYDKFNNKVPMTTEEFKGFVTLVFNNYFESFVNYVGQRDTLQ